MLPSPDVSPRRLTGAEEAELVEAVQTLKQSHAQTERARADRDRLILDLVESNARIVDVMDVVGLTRKAIREAMDRAREQSPCTKTSHCAASGANLAGTLNPHKAPPRPPTARGHGTEGMAPSARHARYLFGGVAFLARPIAPTV